MDWILRGQRIDLNTSNIFSIYLNEELNQKVNNKNNKKNNSSNSLVFGHWPQTTTLVIPWSLAADNTNKINNYNNSSYSLVFGQSLAVALKLDQNEQDLIL